MKRIISILCCISVIFALSACGSSENGMKHFDKKAKNGVPSDSLIAENGKYRLDFDKATGGVILTELLSGEKWSTTPIENGAEEYDEFGMPIKKHSMLQSPITIRYRDYNNNSIYQSMTYNDVLSGGRVRCAKGENSLLVEFYFDTAEIMVPVEYKLLDDSVQITVDPKRIEQNDNALFDITIAPFLCSAKNGSENSYIFFPSGSGAIINTDVRSQQGENVSYPIYGRDYTEELKTDVLTEESIKLPVFGAKISDKKAVAAIVTSGSESGLIKASAGSTAIGYTAVYTTFQVRGYTEHEAEVFIGKKGVNYVYTERLLETPYSVRYYPLTGEQANYGGMAECYRNYLLEEKKLTAQATEDVPFAVTLTGGAEITKSFLGIPYKSFYATTTFSDAEEIITDLYKKTGVSFPVTLKGFGNSGVDVGTVAGGFDINGSIGNVKDLNKLKKLCEANKNKLYMDFDLLRFSKSGDGFSIGSDIVYDVTNKEALQYLYNPSTRDYNKKTKHFLLRHTELNKAADKLIKETKDFSLDGISLATLSNISYSDYKDKTASDYYCRSGLASKVSEIYSAVKKSGKSVMASNANAYAAVKADIITDVAVVSSGNNLFAADVPFYQMVFKGYVPMVSGSQNLSDDYKKLLLKSVEGGCGLNYTLTASWNNSLIDTSVPLFYNSVYDEIAPLIVDNYKKLKNYYDKINGAHISDHRILDNGVRETVFDNNIKVYVNLSENALSSPVGEIAAYDFVVKEGA